MNFIACPITSSFLNRWRVNISVSSARTVACFCSLTTSCTVCNIVSFFMRVDALSPLCLTKSTQPISTGIFSCPVVISLYFSLLFWWKSAYWVIVKIYFWEGRDSVDLWLAWMVGQVSTGEHNHHACHILYCMFGRNFQPLSGSSRLT